MMGDRRLDRLLVGLGAQLEASELRAEEEAADDLALSLAQDRRLSPHLSRGGAVRASLPDGSSHAVVSVGIDFVWTGDPGRLLIPLGEPIFIRSRRGRAPEQWNVTLVQLCRALARSGSRVELLGHRPVQGLLELAARDFVAVKDGQKQVVFGYDAISAIRVVSGDLGDVL